MSRWPIWLPRVLAESVLIVLSVLLALAADEWRESRRHRREAATAQREIVEELRTNRNAVREALRYHSTLVDTLAAHRDSAWTPSPRLFSRGFVAPAQLSQTAWSSASETGTLTHMDYRTVLELSRVYAQQERYEVQARAIGQILYNELYQGGTGSVVRNHRNLASIIGAFRYRERELLEVYARTLAPLSMSDTRR